MALLDQLERAAGRKIPVAYAEEVIADFGVTRKEFFRTLQARGIQIDIRRFITGEEKAEGPLLMLITERDGGFFIGLWGWREYMRQQP